jgi:hypothetical protein
LQGEADAEAVPGIDRGDSQGQVGDFPLVEVRAQCIELGLRSTALRQQGQAFGPGQGGTLAGAEKAGFAPDAQAMQALLALAAVAGILAVHVDAEGAAIQLRGAQADQLQQRQLDIAAGQRLLQAEHGLVGGGGFGAPIIDTGGHGKTPVG